MNYLAHLVLSEPTDDSRLGGMIGDFMRGRTLAEFAPGVQAGVLRHRRVDELTDAHPVFRRSRARLAPEVGRFAGIVVDVAFDHFLARDFERWHPAELAGFTGDCYALFERRRDELPGRLQASLPWIVGHDWLGSYAEAGHLERAFAGIGRRARQGNPLHRAFAAFEANYVGLAADFAEFFPAIQAALEVPTSCRTTRTP